MGIGSICLKLGHLGTELTTIEGCPETHKQAKDNYKQVGIDIDAVCSTFDAYLNAITNESYDLIFIDGHHDGQALLDYLEKLKRHTHNDTVFILDDIRWSDSMFEAWNQLTQSKQYNLCLDLFRMGVLIPAANSEPQHLTVLL